MLLHSTCPSMSGNETTDAPRSLEELTKQCILLKPKLETHFFLELGDNPFHKLFRGTNQDIILTKYAHQSNSLSSLYQPPPSTHTGFSSQLFLQDNIEKWDGLVPGTQSENPLLSMRIAPFKDTPIVEEGIPEPVEYDKSTKPVQDMTDSPVVKQPNETKYTKNDLITSQGTDPHYCLECGKGVGYSIHSFRSHFRVSRGLCKSTNEGKRFHRCLYCKTDFLKSSSLRDHNARFGHKCKAWQLSLNRTGFIDNFNGGAREPIRSAASISLKPTELQSLFDKLKAAQNDGPYFCPHCDRGVGCSFARLKTHIRHHNGKCREAYAKKKFYSCQLCHADFLDIYRVRYHNIKFGNSCRKWEKQFYPENKKACFDTFSFEDTDSDGCGNETPSPTNDSTHSSSTTLKSPNNNTEYSSESEYSYIDSDSDTQSSQHSATSNLITRETTTDIHSEHNAINIGNRTTPDFNPKRIKLMVVKIPLEEKWIKTHIKQHQKLTNDTIFKESKPIHHKPWTRQEEKSLIIGVIKYGKNWKKIHTTFNFSPFRTVVALHTKHNLLKRNGKFSRYLRVFLKNAGYKSHDQSKPEKSDSDKDDRVDEQHTQSVRLTHDSWTYQEKENLVIGVERYGFNWEKIHSSFNFSSFRSYSSLGVKLDKMRRHGECDEILRTYGRKVARGILLDSQAGCKV